MHFLAHFGNVKKQMKEIGPKKVIHDACFTEGGGSKAIWAMPIHGQHILKRGLPYLVLKKGDVCFYFYKTDISR